VIFFYVCMAFSGSIHLNLSQKSKKRLKSTSKPTWRARDPLHAVGEWNTNVTPKGRTVLGPLGRRDPGITQPQTYSPLPKRAPDKRTETQKGKEYFTHGKLKTRKGDATRQRRSRICAPPMSITEMLVIFLLLQAPRTTLDPKDTWSTRSSGKKRCQKMGLFASKMAKQTAKTVTPTFRYVQSVHPQYPSCSQHGKNSPAVPCWRKKNLNTDPMTSSDVRSRLTSKNLSRCSELNSGPCLQDTFAPRKSSWSNMNENSDRNH
jgi:hypothetical protein